MARWDKYFSGDSVRFRLHYEVTCDLPFEDLWPDGDAPANPTVEDVERLIEASGGWETILRTWSLTYKNDKRKTSVVKLDSEEEK